jgi:hypothetical protein
MILIDPRGVIPCSYSKALWNHYISKGYNINSLFDIFLFAAFPYLYTIALKRIYFLSLFTNRLYIYFTIRPCIYLKGSSLSSFKSSPIKIWFFNFYNSIYTIFLSITVIGKDYKCSTYLLWSTCFYSLKSITW